MSDDKRFQGDHVGSSELIKVPEKANTETSRAVAEVQAAVVSAKKFPRDTMAAYAAIVEACKRPRVAEGAMYAYDRGGSAVTGPSIRLAEILAQNYGNLSFGIVELERSHGESQMMAFCHDLQSNTRQTRVFAVPHIRSSKAKGRQLLTDDRDVYEMTANQGARRLRACILGIIPPDFVDGAIEQCEKTIQEAGKNIPIADRVRAMITAFSEVGVTKEMIEKKLAHTLDAVNEKELINLRNIFTSIRDKFAERETYFEMPKNEDANPLNEALKSANIEVPKIEPAAEVVKSTTLPPEPKAETYSTVKDFVITFGRYSGVKLSEISKKERDALYLQLKSLKGDKMTPDMSDAIKIMEKYGQ